MSELPTERLTPIEFRLACMVIRRVFAEYAAMVICAVVKRSPELRENLRDRGLRSMIPVPERKVYPPLKSVNRKSN